jgi:hypothetical protein
MFDTKKLTTTPENLWQAIDALIKKEQELISALHIMESVVNNPSEDFKELHEKSINEFLSKYRVSA